MARGTGAVKEFKEFIMRGNVVDLAVAVVIGVAFGAVIASFVSDLLTPLIAAIFGKQDFSTLTFTINGSTFKYGSFINALITFAMVAAAVFFFIVRPVNYLRERQAKGQEEAPPPTEEVQLLTEIRDALRGR